MGASEDRRRKGTTLPAFVGEPVTTSSRRDGDVSTDVTEGMTVAFGWRFRERRHV